ncbi:MAG TPA: glycosyltransferase family 39 protein, partial [Candidatus Polarisedimenticolia bacterium]|nr:glycosyltransferase family 39 protein [Candidatus Polarisedimenticolia bacterium]
MTAYCPWGLWEPDEGRYADVAGQMLARGDLITPRIDGAVFVDKPPLVYWVTAGCLAALGRNEAAARMGQILFAAGTLFVVYRIGLLLVSRRDAGFAVIILASSAGFFAGGHILTLDLALTFFVALTLLGFLRWYHAGGAGWRWQVVMFAGAAGGVLAKGLIGVVLPALVIASFLTIRREWPRAREIRWVRCGLLFLAIAAPWHVAVAAANPGFLHHYFVQEHLARLATSYHHRPGGWGYYPLVLAAALIPWSLILPAHLVRSRPSLRGLSATLRAEASAFFLSWLLPGLIF